MKKLLSKAILGIGILGIGLSPVRVQAQPLSDVISVTAPAWAQIVKQAWWQIPVTSIATAGLCVYGIKALRDVQSLLKSNTQSQKCLSCQRTFTDLQNEPIVRLLWHTGLASFAGYALIGTLQHTYTELVKHWINSPEFADTTLKNIGVIKQAADVFAQQAKKNTSEIATAASKAVNK